MYLKNYQSPILILLFFINSCQINGSFQGLYGYQKKVNKQYPNLIQQSNESICQLRKAKEPIIYAINGNAIKKCIQNMDKVLLYIWSPNCSSDICISPNTMQNISDENKLELFIVAEYYDAKQMLKLYTLKRPIFGIDQYYYKSNLTKNYLPKFLKDVTNTEIINARYFIFEKGQLKEKTSSLDKFKSITF